MEGSIDGGVKADNNHALIERGTKKQKKGIYYDSKGSENEVGSSRDLLYSAVM